MAAILSSKQLKNFQRFATYFAAQKKLKSFLFSQFLAKGSFFVIKQRVNFLIDK